MSDRQTRLDFETADPLEARDAEARQRAIDPRRNVALEASAGTGKTRVLVDRYVGLLAAGVAPRNILAITFTRKAAAEMRQRIRQEIARRRASGLIGDELWRRLRDETDDIAISTIDAFCLSLLREFPLEAGVDPGFDLADETETPRLLDEALDRTLRIARNLAPQQPEVALLFVELGENRLREALARLIERRLVAAGALARYLRRVPRLDIDQAAARLVERLRAGTPAAPRALEDLVASGPPRLEFEPLARDIRRLVADPPPRADEIPRLLDRLCRYVLTRGGTPRKRVPDYGSEDFPSRRDRERHLRALQEAGALVAEAVAQYRRDLNTVLARAAQQLLQIAEAQYASTLRKHGVLDFAEVLGRALELLRQMEEFSRSRFKLEARYQHVLVDEFQDTSRAQWELVELLVRSWASGAGLASGALDPTIFIVGDRKQSIYGFRDAEVAVLDEAARFIEALRPQDCARLAITRSFRSVRELLQFVNDVGASIEKAPGRPDAFRYDEDDRFPIGVAEISGSDALGVIAASSDEEQAEIVAGEIAALLAGGAVVRDRETGVRRPVRPGDIAILFRTRDGHRAFEDALARRRVPFYVYKGLGFYDADEIKDVLAALSFLARPHSSLHAAAFLRSRFVRLSDEALKHLAPDLPGAIFDSRMPEAAGALGAEDRRRLALARASVPGWRRLVDRLPPAELLDRVISESAYAAELAGAGHRQARENLKKIRSLVRRLQNRGYATVARIADHFARLVAGGDESNAIIDAIDAVNLMTAHAAKGLEFPIVFVVNLQRGSGGTPDPIRVLPEPVGQEEEAAAPIVAVGARDLEEEDREELKARDREESKRLLYVALTRARDRLYLAATLRSDGRFVPGSGGLGSVLPPGVAALFPAAAEPGAGTHVVWEGESGRHHVRVVRPSATDAMCAAGAESADDEVDLSPVGGDGPRRVPATHLALVDAGMNEMGVERVEAMSSRSVGLLVHRALEAQTDDLDALLRDEQVDGWEARDEIILRARETLGAIRAAPEMAAILASPETIAWRACEVPFSWTREDGTIVRGAFDCVVVRTSGQVEIFEFKTGRRAPEHERQLEIYVAAARALFPGQPVNGHLVYAVSADVDGESGFGPEG